MVATLARLRLRLLRNTLLREKWRIVLLVLGLAYGLALLGLAVAGLVALGVAAGPEVRDVVVVVAGSLLVLGWIVVPVVAFGMDDTLDPQRFSPFLVPSPRFAVGLLVASVVSIPGAITVLLCLATALVWVGSGPPGQRVGATAVGLVTGALGAVLCVLLARVSTTAAAGFVRGRRGRDMAGLVGFAAIIALAFVPSLLQSVSLDLATFRMIADVLAWTPLGVPWAIPADVAAGSFGIAAARLGVLVVTLAVAGRLYVWLLYRSMTTVGSGGGGTVERSSRLPFANALLARARSHAQPEGSGSTGGGGPRGLLGALGLAMTPATAAVAGRSLRYWRGDPRYVASAGSIALMPLMAILVAFLASTQGDVAPRAAFGIASLFLGPIAAWLGAWSLHNDVAYDSTAFWLHVSTGARGSEDRFGRVLGIAVWLVPAVVILAVVPPVVLGQAVYVPAVLGGTLALLGAGFGVSSVMSVTTPYPAPPPGASPLSTKSGGAMLSMVAQLVSMLAVGILVLPAFATLLLVVLVDPAWGWLTLVVGAASGMGWLVLGVRRGGALYERRSVAVLTSIRGWPTH